MKNRLVTVMLLAPVVGLFMAASAGAGTNNFLVAPFSPTNPASAMYTLNDVYNKLDTRAPVAMRTGSFTEPSGGPTNGTMHTLNEIMTLVTNRAPVPKSGQTDTFVAGDDGMSRIGVAWPNPRFSPVAALGAETNQIRDNLTGLIWARDANMGGIMTWSNAIVYCEGLTYGGTNDWRLPNVRELSSLIRFGYVGVAISDGTGTNQWTEALGPFTGIPSWTIYWSSSALGTDLAWDVRIYSGAIEAVSPSSTYYVWPVRGGQ